LDAFNREKNILTFNNESEKKEERKGTKQSAQHIHQRWQHIIFLQFQTTNHLFKSNSFLNKPEPKTFIHKSFQVTLSKTFQVSLSPSHSHTWHGTPSNNYRGILNYIMHELFGEGNRELLCEYMSKMCMCSQMSWGVMLFKVLMCL